MQSDDSREHVSVIGPEDTGRWLVETRGTQHVWDLGRMEYTRLPRPDPEFRAMKFHSQPMRITRAVQWPKVGMQSWIWSDAPELPRDIEHYRMSSEVRSITPRVDSNPEVETWRSATDEA